MRIYLLSLVLLFCGITAGCTSVDDKLGRMVKDENQECCPKMLNETVRLDSISLAPERHLYLHYTINHTKIENFTDKDIKQEAYATKRALVRGLRSGNNEFGHYKDFEVTFHRIDRDVNGNVLSEVVVIPKEYK